MAAGFQAFDGTANLLVDTSMSCGRLLAVIDASALSGAVAIAGLETGIGFAIPLVFSTNPNNYGLFCTAPVCSYAGNVISWTRTNPYSGQGNAPAMPSCHLIVGVR